MQEYKFMAIHIIWQKSTSDGKWYHDRVNQLWQMEDVSDKMELTFSMHIKSSIGLQTNGAHNCSS